MQEREIEFYSKSVYGVTHEYIKDEKLAYNIQALTGTKTLLPVQKKALENLGFTFVEVLAPKK